MLNMKIDSIDLIVTSPPYDDLRTYTNGNMLWNSSVWEPIIDSLYKVTKKGGVVVWIVGDAVVNKSETGSSFKQALYFIKSGFNLHDTMIWQKPNFSNPSKTRYHQTFEYMFIFSKGSPKTFNPIKDRKNVYGGMVGSYGKNTATQKDGSKVVRKSKINSEYGMRHNVWLEKTSGQTSESKSIKHPAMFPLQLIKDHIITWSNQGDLVYDPFMGSGTTGVAALSLERNFIGSEIIPEYFKIADDRIGAMI